MQSFTMPTPHHHPQPRRAKHLLFIVGLILVSTRQALQTETAYSPANQESLTTRETATRITHYKEHRPELGAASETPGEQKQQPQQQQRQYPGQDEPSLVPIVRTYEQIALVGSEVRLVCPHVAAALAPMNARRKAGGSFATVITKQGPQQQDSIQQRDQQQQQEEQQQLASYIEGTKAPSSHKVVAAAPATTATTGSRSGYDGHEQIRWFRNHIPLQNGRIHSANGHHNEQDEADEDEPLRHRRRLAGPSSRQLDELDRVVDVAKTNSQLKHRFPADEASFSSSSLVAGSGLDENNSNRNSDLVRHGGATSSKLNQTRTGLMRGDEKGNGRRNNNSNNNGRQNERSDDGDDDGQLEKKHAAQYQDQHYEQDNDQQDGDGCSDSACRHERRVMAAAEEEGEHGRKSRTELAAIHHRTLSLANVNELSQEDYDDEQFGSLNSRQSAMIMANEEGGSEEEEDNDRLRRRRRAVARATVLDEGSDDVSRQRRRRLKQQQQQLTALSHANDNKPEWFINEFGELVLLRISSSSAGSYTCLYDGQQSEVLLDVLSSGGSSSADDESLRDHSTRLESFNLKRIVVDRNRAAKNRQMMMPSETDSAASVETNLLDRAGQFSSGEALGEASNDDDGGHEVTIVGQRTTSTTKTGSARPVDVGNYDAQAGRQVLMVPMEERQKKVVGLAQPERGPGIKRLGANVMKEASDSGEEEERRESQLYDLPTTTTTTTTTTLELQEQLTAASRPTTRALTNDRRHRRLVVVSRNETAPPDKDLAARRQSLTTPLASSYEEDEDNNMVVSGSPETIQTNGPTRNSAQLELGAERVQSSHTNQAASASAAVVASALDISKTTTMRHHPKWAYFNALAYRRPQAQLRPLHLVESEIISNHDLESIPGFLYTKQQFYCPLMNQADLLAAIEDQINLLIGKFCRPAQKAASDRQQVVSNDEEEDDDGRYIDCARLVNRLIAQLMEIHDQCARDVDTGSGVGVGVGDNKDRDINNNNSNSYNGQIGLSHSPELDCFNSRRAGDELFEVVWYKDGSKLSFDSNGRGTDSRLNVKLIDFIDQPPETASPSSWSWSSLSSSHSSTDNSNKASAKDSKQTSSGESISTREHMLARSGGEEEEEEGPSLLLGLPRGGNGRQKQQWQKQGRRKSRKRTIEHQQHRNFVCPPKGLILQIDGIRRPNAGRYTCALKFNNAKLRSSLGTLKRLQQSNNDWLLQQHLASVGSGQPGSSIGSSGGSNIGSGKLLDAAGCLVGKNDNSKCCDAKGQEKTTLSLRARHGHDPGWPPRAAAAVEAAALGPEIMDNVPEMDDKTTTKAIKFQETMGANSSSNNNKRFGHFSHLPTRSKSDNDDDLSSPMTKFHAFGAGSSWPLADHSAVDMEQAGAIRDNQEEVGSSATDDIVPRSFMSKQIKTLRSILNESAISSEQTWSHLKETIFSSQPAPMIVQTFLLLVTERPANSCSLWSTIREANDAYSRRKLTDFKRLKRSLMKPMGATINANNDNELDVRRRQSHRQRQQQQWAGQRSLRHGRRQAHGRLENLNGFNGRQRIGHSHPIKAGLAEQPGQRQWQQWDNDSDQKDNDNGDTIRSNGNANDDEHRAARNIDGKLVASLSWLNGDVESDGARDTTADTMANSDARQRRRQGAARDDDDEGAGIENARPSLEQKKPPSQQNLFVSTIGRRGSIRSDNNDEHGDEVRLDQRQLGPIMDSGGRGVHHHSASSHDARTNGSLKLEPTQIAPERWPSLSSWDAGLHNNYEPSTASQLTAYISEPSSRDATDQSGIAATKTTTTLTNNASKQTEAGGRSGGSATAAVEGHDRSLQSTLTTNEDEFMAQPALENAEIPFNYANERNLNRNWREKGNQGEEEEVRLGAELRRHRKQAFQTIVESFDLHPKTFDPRQTAAGRLEEASSSGTGLGPETKRLMAAKSARAPFDGTQPPPLALLPSTTARLRLDEMRLDQAKEKKEEESQRIDIGVGSDDGRLGESSVNQRRETPLVDDGYLVERRSPTRRLTSSSEAASSAQLRANALNQAIDGAPPTIGRIASDTTVLIDNSDGRVNTLAKYVIDGSQETSQAADQDDSSASSFDEGTLANEVSFSKASELKLKQKLKLNGRERQAQVGSGQLGSPGKQFDSHDGAQTNSSPWKSQRWLPSTIPTPTPSSSSSSSSSLPPFGRISEREFVTKKSNIRMRDRTSSSVRRLAPRLGAKFNNIATVRAPAAQMKSTRMKTPSRRLDGDNFINSLIANNNNNRQQQRQNEEQWHEEEEEPRLLRRGKRLLDDQSDRRHRPVLFNVVGSSSGEDTTSSAIAHDNDDALSIGYGHGYGYGLARANGEQGPHQGRAHESKLESGHKLQLSSTERRRRFSRSDKSAGSIGGGGAISGYGATALGPSGPLRRHRRLASWDGGNEGDDDGDGHDQIDNKIPSASKGAEAGDQVIKTGSQARGGISSPRANSNSIQYGSAAFGGRDEGDEDDEEEEEGEANGKEANGKEVVSSSLATTLNEFMVQDEEIATSPGASEKPPTFSAPNGQWPGPTWNADSSNISKNDADSIKSDPLSSGDGSLMGSAGAAENDENLLWTAGQYLYMHMRAFAASSLYGVQVDVEWSNENEWTRINRTSNEQAHGQAQQPSGHGDNDAHRGGDYDADDGDFNVSEYDGSGRRRFRAGARTNSLAPIATIELVSGQDLHLQCTAQALGRLPEVSWYKRVKRVPDHVPETLRNQMARSLGGNHFWPVASLGLLDGDDDDGSVSDDDDAYNADAHSHGDDDDDNEAPRAKFASNFVCSQSVTIFDNLLNQTFTVVNSLKLSEHKERKASRDLVLDDADGVTSEVGSIVADQQQKRQRPIKDRRHYNLYACMVTADVRHEYVTLGVNIRHASRKLPLELSKRLRAAHSKSELATVHNNNNNRDVKITKQRVVVPSPTAQIIDVDVSQLPREGSDYSFLRQSQLLVPSFGGAWVPIRNKNGTYLGGDDDDLASLTIYNATRYSITPIMLALVIASLSSLLVALIYFTMRSYRALTNLQIDEECLDCTNKQHLPDDHQHDAADRRPHNLVLDSVGNFTAPSPLPQTLPMKTASTYCEFDPKGMAFEHKLKHHLNDDDDDDGNQNDDHGDDYLALDAQQSAAAMFQHVGEFKSKTEGGGLPMSKLKCTSGPLGFYEAHFHHDSEARSICNEISASLFGDIITTEIKNELEYTFNSGGCTSNKPCCVPTRSDIVNNAPAVGEQQTTSATWDMCGQTKINMVANPLNKL